MKNTPEPKPAGRWDLKALPFILLLVVFYLTVKLLPDSYLFYAVDHALFISGPFDIIWFLFSLLLLVYAARFAPGRRMPRAALIGLAMLTVLTFFLFRTEFPSVHGDGEGGGSPQQGVAELSSWPDHDARLQAFLAAGLSKIVPDGLRFHYYFPSAHINHPVNNTWIVLVLTSGILLVVLLTRTFLKLDRDNLTRFGLLLISLTSAATLNAYGHFDSYIIPLLLVVVWLILVYRTDRRPGRASNWIALLLLLPVIIWAHPVLAYLAGFAGMLGLLHLLDRFKIRIPVAYIFAASIVYSVAPYFIDQGYIDYFHPRLQHLAGWMVHEKFMALFQAALPALILTAVLLCLRKVPRKTPSPLQAASLFMIWSMSLMLFTLRHGYGLLDEFSYALFGALITGGALLLYLASKPEPRLLIYTGLLSLYLFFPRLVLYSGDGVLDRFEQHTPKEYTKFNLLHGPYKLMAMNVPINRPEFRERRLDILEKGFLDPPPVWRREKERALAFFIVWAYEFDRIERTEGLLESLIDRQANILGYLWLEKPDPFQTGAYRGISKKLIRRDCRAILDQRLAAEPENESYQVMMEVLNQMDKD